MLISTRNDIAFERDFRLNISDGGGDGGDGRKFN